MKDGWAAIYYEPEKKVVSRSGDDCIVALCDQWYLKYGEETWKNSLLEFVKSDKFNAFRPACQKKFEEALGWLKEWGCSRSYGLGTKLPCDPQYLIESLSDSTIYFAFYTISHFLQKDSLDGSTENEMGIKAEDMTPEVWDYVFLKGEYPAGCKINEEHLKKMRHEFEFWYPMDLRCSAKDLIPNHLTFSLYNHDAIWQDPAKMPKAMFCNGYIMLNGEKMSKGSGNFMTLSDAVDKFGADATRLAMADSGDGLEDANFDEKVANSSIMHLYVFEQWIKETIKKVDFTGADFSKSEEGFDAADEIFNTIINGTIIDSKMYYDEIRYKDVVKFGFHEFQTAKDFYMQMKNGKPNPILFLRFIEAATIILTPICPHFCENIWQKIYLPEYKKIPGSVERSETVLVSGWPKITSQPNPKLRMAYDYLRKVKHEFRLNFDKSKAGGKKKGKGKANEVEKKITSVAVFVSKNYLEWQE
jgi:leucyl-tRNA synthetase